MLTTFHHLQSVFSCGSVVRVFKSKFLTVKGNNYFSSLSLGCIVYNNLTPSTDEHEKNEPQRQTNQGQIERSPDKQQQLNHHRWKKHTMYPKYISKWFRATHHLWMKLWLSYVAIYFKRVFKYIEDWNCDETWQTCFCVHFAFRYTFMITMPLSLYCTFFMRRSIKISYASCLFAKVCIYAFCYFLVLFLLFVVWFCCQSVICL